MCGESTISVLSKVKSKSKRICRRNNKKMESESFESGDLGGKSRRVKRKGSKLSERVMAYVAY